MQISWKNTGELINQMRQLADDYNIPIQDESIRRFCCRRVIGDVSKRTLLAWLKRLYNSERLKHEMRTM